MTDKTVTNDVYRAMLGWLGDALPNAGFADNPEAVQGQFTAGRYTGDWSVPDEVTMTWVATFTAQEEEDWDRAVKKARRRTEAVDDAVLDPYWDTMRTYYNTASPNAAATVQALKATIKVLREMMKE